MELENNREEIIKKILTAIGAETVFVYLYGSAQKDQLEPESDIDIAIYVDPWPMPVEQQQSIREKIASQFNRPAQVLILNNADPIIVRQVHQTGELIVNRDPDAELNFRIFKIAEYCDLKMSRKIIEENLMQKGWPRWPKKTSS